MNSEIQSLCLKLALRGVDEQKVEKACSSLGDGVVLSILRKMEQEGPKRKGAIIELRITQFSRMVKMKQREEAARSKSEQFLMEQQEQMELSNKERSSGFSPDKETLRVLIDSMLNSGEISIPEYECAMNFLGTPGEQRQQADSDFDIPF